MRSLHLALFSTIFVCTIGTPAARAVHVPLALDTGAFWTCTATAARPKAIRSAAQRVPRLFEDQRKRLREITAKAAAIERSLDDVLQRDAKLV